MSSVGTKRCGARIQTASSGPKSCWIRWRPASESTMRRRVSRHLHSKVRRRRPESGEIPMVTGATRVGFEAAEVGTRYQGIPTILDRGPSNASVLNGGGRGYTAKRYPMSVVFQRHRSNIYQTAPSPFRQRTTGTTPRLNARALCAAESQADLFPLHAWLGAYDSPECAEIRGPGSSRHRGRYSKREPWSSHFSFELRKRGGRSRRTTRRRSPRSTSLPSHGYIPSPLLVLTRGAGWSTST